MLTWYAKNPCLGCKNEREQPGACGEQPRHSGRSLPRAKLRAGMGPEAALPVWVWAFAVLFILAALSVGQVTAKAARAQNGRQGRAQPRIERGSNRDRRVRFYFTGDDLSQSWFDGDKIEAIKKSPAMADNGGHGVFLIALHGEFKSHFFGEGE